MLTHVKAQMTLKNQINKNFFLEKRYSKDHTFFDSGNRKFPEKANLQSESRVKRD